MRSRGLVNGLSFKAGYNAPRKQLAKAQPCWARPAIAVCIAGIVASSLVWCSVASRDRNEETARTLTPPPPYILYGFSVDGLGYAVPDCNLNLSNLNTAEYVVLTTDSNGYYQYDLANMPSGYTVGDEITLTSASESYSGANQTTVTGTGGKWLNVTLVEVVIPEFSSLVIPVVGCLVLFAVYTFRRRTKADP
jgi:hypothetical protein